MKHKLITLFVLLALLLALAPVQPAHALGNLYAKPVASGLGNCSSWANACTLQTALTNAPRDTEIWAAMGTHRPTTSTVNRDATFQLKDSVAVYGGFKGTETTRDQRDPAANVTVLSGDIDRNDSQTPIITDISTVTGNGTNSYHVVTGITGATLDGVTITAGFAGGDYPSDRGGGMYNASNSNPVLTNVTFSGNAASDNGGGMCNSYSNPMLTTVTFSSNAAHYGGGMYNNHSSPILNIATFSGNVVTTTGTGGGMYNAYSSNPTMTDVTFSGNLSAYYGGGMGNYESSPILTNVTFSSNSATNHGGGMYNARFSSPVLTNVTFSGNTTTEAGGGMINTESNPTLTNVTFSDNTANRGGGMNNGGVSNPTLTNVTFSGNTATDIGGGIYNMGGTLLLTNVTFSGNTATNRGGGMWNNSSNPQIRNTIFWGNTATTGAQIYNNDSISAVVNDSVVQDGCPADSTCTNIITADPLLGALGDNGGFTLTIPIQAGSSAIDAGDDAICPDTDQRGLSRPWDGDGSGGAACDIGAYEVPSPSPVFADVPVGYWAISHIESLYANGITGGCTVSPLNYCPANPVTRAQMAVFLLKAMYGAAYVPADATGTIFNDVPASNPFAKWIEQLAAEGITGGCGGGNYCPNTPVTREQMAVFLLVAEHGTGYTPPAATGVFADVPASNGFAPWIEALAAEGITGGCGGGNFCPKTIVTRAQMAVFLVTAFNLP
ncbi:MAG: S-layer homology domain-containing protein [Chloroflexi bacterium]|nr:S-layer homology domain-containing protein [Chloroflexota bacterium]